MSNAPELDASQQLPNPVHRAGWVLSLLVFLNVLNIVDRNLLASFAPQITADLNLSDFEFGLLNGVVFVFFYAVMGLFVGRLADRHHRPRLIAAGLVLWSALTMVSGAAKNFVQLAIARMFIGVGESALTPSSMSMLADLYPQHKRGAVTGLYYLGVPLGAGASFVIAGVIGPMIGWRNCFYVLGGLGLLLTPLLLLTRDPKRGHFDVVKPDPLADMGLIVALRQVYTLCRERPALGFAMIGSVFMHIPIGAASFALLWLVRERGFGESEIQILYGSLLFVFGFVGTFLGGYLSDWYQARFAGGRLRFLAWFLIVLTPLLLGYRFVSPESPFFYVAMSAGLVSFMAFYAPVFSTVQDLSPPDMRGVSTAVLLFMSNILGIGLGAVTVGALSAGYTAIDIAQPLTWSLITVDLLSIFTVVSFWIGSVYYERDKHLIIK
jgi:MFS family permease